MIQLSENERIDKLHRNNYVIIQNKSNFCFGVDAVLLSHFARANEGEIVMDICTGTGIIPILMSAKTKAKKFDAIDIQENLVKMAQKSIKINNLENKVNIFHCDVKNILNKFEKNSYDLITVNPPYIKQRSGILNKFNSIAISRHEILCTFEDIAYNSSKILKNKGRIYLVHKVSRLADVISILRGNCLEPKKIQFVQPYFKSEPNLFLMEAIKNANPELKVLPSITVYNQDGTYTKEVFDIYYN